MRINRHEKTDMDGIQLTTRTVSEQILFANAEPETSVTIQPTEL